MWNLTEAQTPDVEKESALALLVVQGPTVERIELNTAQNKEYTDPNSTHPVLGDIAMRKALLYATPKQQIIDKLLFGKAKPGSSPVSQGWAAYKEPQEGYDPKKANDVLDAAGWTKGSDGVRSKGGNRLSLTVQTVTGWSDYISINDTLKQQLAAVGIELKPSQVSWNEWNAAQTNGKFQLSLDSVGLGASTNPYFTYNGKLATVNTAPVGKTATAGNQSRFSNPAVDAALKVAAGTTDKAAQKVEYAKIQAVIADQLPYIPVYVNSMLTEFNTSRATGWPTKDDMYVLPAAWKAWDAGIVLKTIKPAS